MQKLLIFICLMMLISCSNKSNILLIRDGVSKELAEYRKQQLSDVVYNLSFDIPLKKEDSILSKLKLEVTANDLNQPLILDFKPDKKYILALIANGKEIPVRYQNAHLIIPKTYLEVGRNLIEIDFIAGEASLNRNEKFLYTLLVPDRSRTLYPCFDQPDIKAVYKLVITSPKDWQVLSAAPLVFKEDNGSFTEHHFKETYKMSTYLFSFVAGNFSVVNNNDPDFRMQMLHQETDQKKINNSITPIFDLHKHSINFLEEYTKYKFPFQKLDFVTIYGFPYGGMEHIGAIQYYQKTLFLDKSATRSQELSRAKVIAHETSHMWFGDLVTMKWFDDVWLKEVFANLMADKIVNPVFPDIDHELHFLKSHFPQAYKIDRTRGANPIRQNLENLNQAGTLYGGIIYHKAPIMMRQLEAILTSDKFQEGLAEYICKYAYNNADWNDLIDILNQKTETDLYEWSKVWVNSSGRPIFSGNISYDNNKKIKSFNISQRAEDGTEKLWPQLFDITFLYPDTSLTFGIYSDKKNILVPETTGLSKPELIIYNSNGYGYGVFPVDVDKLDAIPKLKNEVARGYSYINCFENFLNDNLSTGQIFDLYQESLREESNELILALISDQIKQVYWKYITSDQRQKYLSLLEEILYNRLQQNEKQNIKKTLFSLYISIAYTGKGLDILYQIWNKNISIPDLILNQDNFTDLAMLLALYGYENADTILAEAKLAIKDENKLKRFNFLLPSLSQDENVREAFFDSFSDLKNRAVEDWVQTACYYIHHPLRQKSAIKHLELSLTLLEELQQTGGIFFPKNWLDNTIGQYTSPEAYNILENFLETHPDINPVLKMKILQSTDDLYRVQKRTESETKTI